MWERTFKIGRKLVGVLAPLALLFIAEHAKVEIDPGIRNLVVAWTGLSILALLDPGFAAKLSSVKDVRETFTDNKGGAKPGPPTQSSGA